MVVQRVINTKAINEIVRVFLSIHVFEMECVFTGPARLRVEQAALWPRGLGAASLSERCSPGSGEDCVARRAASEGFTLPLETTGRLFFFFS